MLWLKIIVSAAIVGFCVFLGYLAAGKYRARKNFYAQLSTFNERYLTELTYTRKPLGAFLQDYAYSGDFKKTIVSFAKSRKPELGYSYLTKEEKKECADYLAMLGKGDALSQRNFFGAQRTALEEKRSASEKEAKSRGDLYLKLGLLAGLAFVILIL